MKYAIGSHVRITAAHAGKKNPPKQTVLEAHFVAVMNSHNAFNSYCYQYLLRTKDGRLMRAYEHQIEPA